MVNPELTNPIPNNPMLFTTRRGSDYGRTGTTGTSQSQGSPPAGGRWTVNQDPSTNQSYYYNTTNHDSRWTPPKS